MIVKEAIEGWLLAKQTEVRVTTLKKYKHYINVFASCSELPEQIEQVTKFTIRKVMAQMMSRTDWKPMTIYTFFLVLHDFMTWCYVEDVMELNVMKNIKAPPKTQKQIQIFSLDEVKLILNACNNDRDKLIVRLLLDTAIRRKEIAALRIGDIDFHEGTILLRDTKGGDERVAYISKKLRGDLWMYLKKRLCNKEEFVFESAKGGGLTSDGFRLMLQRLSDKTGLHINPHKFRHTCATWMLERGISSDIVMKVTGHKSERSLAPYKHIRDRFVSDIHDSAGLLKGL